jgi:thiol:disulfide interchange protein
MRVFRPLIISLFAVLIFGMQPAAAAEWQRYSEAKLEAAQAEGKIIYVAVHASWCIICKRQTPVIDALLREKQFEDTVALIVDFDRQRGFLRKYNVPVQATLIAFRGREEISRVMYSANPRDLRAVMESAL